ncbi:chloramphenicol resistance protein [Diaporthe amygdali]|uniref:chloramphenicol resistance protein n=1 Tax=Phomopsis amygdali TaxID=1214568 RepID=UPI0022FE9236|nr:chloramphenicol resistance protein [Diaporthe amygdali]KAJ0114644.1 chloramphenicol resistance protein [Diaporthe amygdali]
MANRGLDDPERSPSVVPPTPPGAAVDAQAIAGQDPSARHMVNQAAVDPSGASPADSQKRCTDPAPSTSDTEEPEPDPEALTRATSGPVYSVFSRGMKKWIIGVVTLTSFISPMTANIYFPALNPIAHDLGVTVTLINLTLTTYMIFQGIAPTIFGDFGDMAGRRPAFIVAVLIYIVANLGLALQNNFAALLILRMVQSGGSSGTLALGYAVVADISTSAERGKYMGVVGAGINVGPSLSPVIGGLLSQYLGWRAIFWFCFIFACSVFVLYGLTVPETCRTIVGNGSVTPTGFNMTAVAWVSKKRRQRKQQKEGGGGGTQGDVVFTEADGTVRQKPKLRFPNPLRALAVVFDKGVGLVILYNSILYLMFITTVATLSTQFKEKYGYDDLQIGLCYLPYGAGCFAAAIGQGYMLDWYYRRTAKSIGFSIDKKRGDDLSNFPIEKARIVPLYFFVAVGIVAVIVYGWVLELRPSVAAPLCLHFVIGLCITGSFGILNTLIVDLSPEAPATAVAANNFVRCEMGAAATAVIELMIAGMGTGWCFTFFALLGVVLMPILWAETKYGIKWRQEKRLRREKKLNEKRDRKERKELEKAAAAVQRETQQK